MLYVVRLGDLYEHVRSGDVVTMYPGEGPELMPRADVDAAGMPVYADAREIDQVSDGAARTVALPTTARDLVRAWRDGAIDAIIAAGTVYGPLAGDMATRRALDGTALAYQGGAWISGGWVVARPRHVTRS